MNLTSDQVKHALETAKTKSKEIGVAMNIAIVDEGGLCRI